MTIELRPLREDELREADGIYRRAFGALHGLADPLAFDGRSSPTGDQHDLHRGRGHGPDPARHLRRIWAFCELEPPGPANSKYQQMSDEIGNLRHSNSYRGFDLVEKLVPENLRKHGYL